MDIKGILSRAFMEGYAIHEINTVTLFVCMGVTAVLALYIYLIYGLMNKNSFYNQNFALSLVELAVITAAIILTIQSNIVVSLGMVGALSIVRFRTAIKDPMDLVFLFWSISVGIICGAGFAIIAVVTSLLATVLLVVIGLAKTERKSQILIINADKYDEDGILGAVKANSQGWKVKARNISEAETSLAIEVRSKDPQSLLKAVLAIEHVTGASLLEHERDAT